MLENVRQVWCVSRACSSENHLRNDEPHGSAQIVSATAACVCNNKSFNVRQRSKCFYPGHKLRHPLYLNLGTESNADSVALNEFWQLVMVCARGSCCPDHTHAHNLSVSPRSSSDSFSASDQSRQSSEIDDKQFCDLGLKV